MSRKKTAENMFVIFVSKINSFRSCLVLKSFMLNYIKSFKGGKKVILQTHCEDNRLFCLFHFYSEPNNGER